MSKAQKLLSLIAGFFAAEKFGKVALEDGTELTFEGEEIVAGETILKMVVVNPETGVEEEVLAPMGEHTLNDGRMIVVEEGTGKVLDIREVQKKQEETKPEEKKDENKFSEEEEMKELEKMSSLIVENFSALKQENAKLKEEVKKVSDKYASDINKLREEFKALEDAFAKSKQLQTKVEVQNQPIIETSKLF